MRCSICGQRKVRVSLFQGIWRGNYCEECFLAIRGAVFLDSAVEEVITSDTCQEQAEAQMERMRELQVLLVRRLIALSDAINEAEATLRAGEAMATEPVIYA